MDTLPAFDVDGLHGFDILQVCKYEKGIYLTHVHREQTESSRDVWAINI